MTDSSPVSQTTPEWWSEAGERTQAAMLASRLVAFASEARLLTDAQRRTLHVAVQDLRDFANG